MTNEMILSKIQNDMQSYGFAVVDLSFQDYALGNDTAKENLPDLAQIEKLRTLIDTIRGNGFELVKVSEIGNQSNATHLIPQWVKHSAQSWSQGNASSSEFLDTIQFMIKKDMIKAAQNTTLGIIPTWVRHDAAWWSSGSVSDQEFTDTIEYLIGAKAIR
ncbi:MAG TPA: hypothetical protein VJ771_02860, partial [Candidatus Nitrosotalea sp.]|nr:hypothetical protein [Candidatus Nitrosotalea sp.]